jgi:glycosyltransferase involved in cell wall biosynthesis
VLYGGALSALEFPLVLVILKIINKPLVVTIHSIIPRSRLGRELFDKYGLGVKLSSIKRILIVLITRSILTLADAVIVHDNYMKECLTLDYEAKNEKTFIVSHGVANVDPFDERRAKSLIGLPDSRIILYQGFVTEGKGVEILIQAFEQVHKIFPDTLLVIAGSFRQETQKYAQSINALIMEKNLSKKVVVTGFVPEEDLPKYYFASEIIVLPYTEKDVLGTSEVLAEVAMVGKPVVATRTPKFIGLLRDGHNALLVEPESVEQLSAAILRVLSDEKLARRLATVLMQDASNNTWEKTGLATIEVYNRVLGLN